MILIGVFIIPIILAYGRKFNMDRIKDDILELEIYMAALIALGLGFYIISYNRILEKAISIIIAESPGIVETFNKFPYVILIVTFLIVTTIIFFMVNLVIKIINRIFVIPILKRINRKHKFKGFKKGGALASLFYLPRSIFYLMLIFIAMNMFISTNTNNNVATYINTSTGYQFVKETIIGNIAEKGRDKLISLSAMQSSDIVPASAKVYNKAQANNKNIVNLYNGVTIEDGVKSNDDIRNKSLEITKSSKSDLEKAKIIYSFVGSTIEYDDAKADNIDRQGKNKSGAIPAFKSKKGVCFDYACLFVAMAEEAGLNVRLVSGEAFNGNSWESHAWNEVYIKEEDRWIDVDPTFYKAGNYFDNKDFKNNHTKQDLLWEA